MYARAKPAAGDSRRRQALLWSGIAAAAIITAHGLALARAPLKERAAPVNPTGARSGDDAPLIHQPARTAMARLDIRRNLFGFVATRAPHVTPRASTPSSAPPGSSSASAALAPAAVAEPRLIGMAGTPARLTAIFWVHDQPILAVLGEVIDGRYQLDGLAPSVVTLVDVTTGVRVTQKLQ